MDKLPLELGEFIFQYVKLQDQLRMAKGHIGGFIEAVLALRLECSIHTDILEWYEDWDDSMDNMDVLVSAFPLIRILKFFYCDPPFLYFEAIGRMEKLRELYLEGYGTYDDNIAFAYISKGKSRHLLEKLEIFDMRESYECDKTLFCLQHFTNLKSFSINHTCYGFNDLMGVAPLCSGESFNTLESLDIHYITDYECELIVNLPALRNLVIGGFNLTDRGFHALCSNKNIEYLKLSYISSKVTYDTFSQIANLPKLKTLILERDATISVDIDDNWILNICKGCSNLEVLTFHRLGSFTRSGLSSALEHLSKLKKFSIYDSDKNQYVCSEK